MAIVKTADLCDRLGAEARVCAAPLRAFGGRRAASGVIATVRAFQDAGLLRQQLEQRGEGRVLVIDAGGPARVAVLGDNMARLGWQNGWSGVVIHGMVRDADELERMPFAVFALGTVPVRGSGAGVGEVGVELRFGGIAFAPGQHIAMDGDGVVVFQAKSA